MSQHISYEELEDLTITEEEAREVYAVLDEYESTEPLALLWRGGFERRFLAGEDMVELARVSVRLAFRWYEWAMMYGAVNAQTTIEMCCDICAAVGIEPPEHPGVSIGHGFSVSTPPTSPKINDCLPLEEEIKHRARRRAQIETLMQEGYSYDEALQRRRLLLDKGSLT